MYVLPTWLGFYGGKGERGCIKIDKKKINNKIFASVNKSYYAVHLCATREVNVYIKKGA